MSQESRALVVALVVFVGVVFLVAIERLPEHAVYYVVGMIGAAYFAWKAPPPAKSDGVIG